MPYIGIDVKTIGIFKTSMDNDEKTMSICEATMDVDTIKNDICEVSMDTDVKTMKDSLLCIGISG